MRFVKVEGEASVLLFAYMNVLYMNVFFFTQPPSLLQTLEFFILSSFVLQAQVWLELQQLRLGGFQFYSLEFVQSRTSRKYGKESEHGIWM